MAARLTVPDASENEIARAGADISEMCRALQ
jgi:hypothetical protein